MSRLDKETIVNKQSRFKYDTKNRKQKEKRNERITLRCTESVKEKFESICQKSGKSQGDIFEEMLNKNKQSFYFFLQNRRKNNSEAGNSSIHRLFLAATCRTKP